MQKILLIVLISILTNSFHYQKQCRWGKREYFINTIHYHNFKNTRECFKTTSYEMDLSHDFFFRGLRAQVQNDVWGHLHRCTILLCVCMIDKTRLYQNQDIHDVGKYLSTIIRNGLDIQINNQLINQKWYVVKWYCCMS